MSERDTLIEIGQIVMELESLLAAEGQLHRFQHFLRQTRELAALGQTDSEAAMELKGSYARRPTGSGTFDDFVIYRQSVEELRQVNEAFDSLRQRLFDLVESL